MLLSSPSNGHPIQTCGLIKRRMNKGIFTAKRRRQLDRIGFDSSASDSRWEKGFAALAKFKAREGNCRVPSRHIEGKIRLGSWVILQRKMKNKLLTERRKRLIALGFVWDGHQHAWEIGFAALTKFKVREGHCRVPRYYIEGAYKLGQWVSVQRLNKDAMPTERGSRLDEIGFVWDEREHFWKKCFTALTKFRAREGHCRVSSFHMERKFKLGQWVATQRRSKGKMPAKRKSQLNKIGFVWRAI